MSEYILWSDSSSSDEESSFTCDERIKRKILRDRNNPMELNELSFVKRFRLSKEAFKYVLDNLPLSNPKTIAGIPNILKLSAALELLASGAYQHTSGNDFFVSLGQSTVSKVFTEILSIMEETLCAQWIKFTKSAATKRFFYEKFGFPNIIGLVDGSHVSFTRPSINEHMFYNRKGTHSLNIMIICNEKKEILAIEPKYGGCTHDSAVWKFSDARRFLVSSGENMQNRCWLLGDSGYPLEPWLITPYRTPLEGSTEMRFNKLHSQIRSLVERCIGEWKGVWRILMLENKRRYAPNKIGQIANVCAALHNIRLHFKIPCPELQFQNDDEDLSSNIENNPPSNLRRQAEITRNSIMNALFQ